jgi:DNA polymerase-3 subunit epsilon
VELCQVLDTLALARELHPGQRNSLDALCKRYDIDNSRRELHGALLDARILADVYLAMTGGQGALALSDADTRATDGTRAGRALVRGAEVLHIACADDAELASHEAMLALINKVSGGHCVWLTGEAARAAGEPRLHVA